MDGFRSDSEVEAVMTRFAGDAPEIAKAKFGRELDWTIESIRVLEELLGEFHKAVKFEHPTEEELYFFSMTFGSYLGEVIRRHQGGDWGWLALDTAEWPGLSHGIWPQIRVQKRIVNGPEENVWHYYVLLFEDRKALDFKT